MVLQILVLSVKICDIKIWRGASLAELHNAQKVHNFVTKMASGGAKYDHVTPYWRELKWLKIKQRYKYELSLSVYNFINRYAPSWLFSLPTMRKTHPVNTRKHN